MSDPLEVQYVRLHGHRRAYVKTGTGPAILLLHGMACDHTTWAPVIEKLAENHTVIAPDLLGHGLSDKPRADYSIGGYANGMRDLLTVLGIDRATVVGHSLGGGVAMQFAYQFPERTDRLVLVAPGGMGPEVTMLIRAVTLPGFHGAVGVITLPGLRQAATALLRAAARLPHPAARDLEEIAAMVEALRDPKARRALRHVVRACVDIRGQVITMVDRAYLTEALPMCVIWGADDPVIPSAHAETVREIAKSARVELVEHAGHFPHKADPDAFVATVEEFVRTTRPAVYSRARWRALLERGAPIELEIADSPVVTGA